MGMFTMEPTEENFRLLHEAVDALNTSALLNRTMSKCYGDGKLPVTNDPKQASADHETDAKRLTDLALRLGVAFGYAPTEY
jgi:hypothetical protein